MSKSVFHGWNPSYISKRENFVDFLKEPLGIWKLSCFESWLERHFLNLVYVTVNYVPTLFLIYKLAVRTCSKSFDYEWIHFSTRNSLFRAWNLFTEKILRSLLCNFPKVQNHVPKTYVYITLQTYSDLIQTKLYVP